MAFYPIFESKRSKVNFPATEQCYAKRGSISIYFSCFEGCCFTVMLQKYIVDYRLTPIYFNERRDKWIIKLMFPFFGDLFR